MLALPVRRPSLVLVSLSFAAACFVAACGSDGGSPTTPTPPAPSVSSVQVKTSGEVAGPLEPGQTRQLAATATQSTGTTSDVTQQAVWQSSATGVATVSPTGLVTAVSAGDVEISATFQNVRGAMGVGVLPTRCDLTISPASAAFNAFGGPGSVQVQVSAASCRWTARSDAAWLPFTFESTTGGSGSFSYTAPPNSTTSPRTANIVVTTSTGQSVAHAVTVEKTSGCSYVAEPDAAVFPASGGTGQFNVIATTGCTWTIVNGLQQLGVSITQGWSGTGNGLVRYTVQAHTRTVDADGYIEIAGLSGAYPNGRHRIVLQKR
jgi:Big-like domain-containing protein/all-beta uncharacterized protein